MINIKVLEKRLRKTLAHFPKKIIIISASFKGMREKVLIYSMTKYVL